MKKYLKPAPGDRIVLGPPPLNERLNDEGEWVDMSPYWYTKLRQQDVVEAKPSKPKSVSEKGA